MCNLSKGVFNSGYDSGYKKAEDNKTVEHIVKLILSREMDVEECMDIFDIPEDKREEYRRAVLAELGLATV